MATRSSIAYKTSRGVTAVYCHWDGYPAHNGAILQEHYQAAYKISRLVNLGDLSVLAEEPIPAADQKGHSFENPFDGVCVYYGRDRGEPNTDCKEFETIGDWVEHYEGAGCEYFYLWDGNEWIVHSRGNTDSNDFPVFDFVGVKLGMME
jgi:hypothetical protein